MNRLPHHNLWGFVKVVCLYFVIVVGIFAVLAGSISTVFAQPSYTINYQGKLTDNTGLAVANGTYDMEFKLYTQASGGAAIWTETRTGGNVVTVTNGLFSVMLGSVTSLGGVNFNQPLYLGVNIEADGEMTPRKLLGTVPSAFEAKQLGGVASTSFLRSDAADSASGLLTFTGGMISTASSTVARLSFLNATGTSLYIGGDRITEFAGTNLEVTGNSLGLSSTYLGQTSITTLGTIGTGVWQGSVISSTYLDTATLLSSELDSCSELATLLGSGATGTCGTVVLSSSPTITTPTFVTNITTPLIYGGTAASSQLTLRSTSGSGTTDDIIFGMGTAGGTQWGRLDNENNAIAFGENAGIGFTSGTINNIALGVDSARNATSSNNDYNITIGYNTGREHRTNNSIMMGFYTGYESTGGDNIIMGDSTGYSNTGSSNVILGYFAAEDNTGSNNNILGQGAADLNTGNFNNIFGYQAGFENTGDYNNFIGYEAGAWGTTGSYNNFLGYEAGEYANGTSSVAVGAQALAGQDYYTAINNTAIGYQAGYNASNTANNNIFLGYRAADNLTTGNNNIIIGYDIDNVTATTDNALNIGNLIFGTGLDGTGTTLASGNIGIGTTSPFAKLAVTNSGSGHSFLVEDSASPDTTPFVITASGDVGVGTISPGRLFNVSGFARFGKGDGGSVEIVREDSGTTANELLGEIRFGTTDGANYNGLISAYASEAQSAGAAGNYLTFSTVATGGTTLSERMRIANDGNVGIGTTTPSAMLSVGATTGSQFLVNSSGVITSSNNITPNSVLSSGQTDEYCLTYESTGTTFAWQACGTGSLSSADIDTSAELDTIVTDNTGSGALVFGTNPTLTGTQITYTSLTASRGLFLDSSSRATTTATSAYLLNSLTDETGTGVAVFGTAPTFTTSITAPIVYGGTAASSQLILRSTSGSGTTDDIIMGVGTNGGTQALRIDNANNSVMLGEDAGNLFTSSTIYNTALGWNAGRQASTTNSDYNNFIGYAAGYSNTGSSSTMIGSTAGYYNSGNFAIFMGGYAGGENTGDYTIALGDAAGWSNTGDYNYFIGRNAGGENTGSNNNSLGNSAGYYNTGGYNNMIGNSAGYSNIGANNIFLGYDAGRNNSNDLNNIMGNSAGYSNSGFNNNLIGSQAGFQNSGWYNDFVGGGFNFGVGVGHYNTGNYNQLFGYQAGGYLQSTSTVSIGAQSLYGSHATTYISLNNVALGYRAGYASDDGSGNNILIGYQAADNLTTGNNNIIIGYDIDNITATADNALNIGNLIFGTGLDGTGTTLASGNIGIGTTSPYAKLSVTNTGTTPSFLVEDSASPDSTPFVVTAAGNVGVGDSNPTAKLAVSANSNNYAQVISQSDNGTLGGSGLYIWVNRTDSTGDAIAFENPSGVAFSVKTNGYVGIGDSTPAALFTVGSGDLFQVNSSGQVLLGSAGVNISGDGDGAVTFLGLGNGSDENLTLNLDDTADTAVFTSSTGLATANFSSIALQESGSNVLSVLDLDTCAEFAALGSIETGTCGTVVLSTSPTFVTDIRTPLIYGGTAASSQLILRSTTGSGTTDDIIMGIGTDGAIQAFRIDNENNSIAMGENAGATFTSSTLYNVAIGFEAGRYASTTAVDYNNMIGHSAGYRNTGTYNQMMGASAGYRNTGNSNIFIGEAAGYGNTGSSNILIGADAGENNTGSFNSYIGEQAGFQSTGSTNNLIGYYAGFSNSGDNNNVIGYGGYDNSGNYNNIIGEGTGYYNAGDYNNFIGYDAGAWGENTGDYNEFIGADAGGFLNATATVAIGAGALFGDNGGGASQPYTAINNVAIGYHAGFNATNTANNNILLGYQAADNLTTGNNNIIIGYDIDNITATADNRLNIGNLIFGSGIDGTGTTLSSGGISIGTSTPLSNTRLTLQSLSTSATAGSQIGSYTYVSDTGNVTSGNDWTYGDMVEVRRSGAGSGATPYAIGESTAVYGGQFTDFSYGSTIFMDDTYGSLATAYDYELYLDGLSSIAEGVGGYIQDNSTTTNSVRGFSVSTYETGSVSGAGTDTTMGAYLDVYRQGASTATIESYGLNVNVDSTGGGTVNNYGGRFDVFGTTGGTSVNYGVYSAVSGADTNYAGIFTGGNVGIGDTTPTQLLDIDGTNVQFLAEESTTEFLRAGVGETAGTSVVGWDDSDTLRLGVYDSPTDTTISTLLSVGSTGATSFSPLTTFTTGTGISYAAAGATTLSGAYTAMSLNLNANFTATGQSMTGYEVMTPSVTNTGAGTYNYRGLVVTGNNLTQNTAAGIDTFTGVYITNSNITQTSGTVFANGVSVTTGTITTAGTQQGFDVRASGVGAGTLNGLNISGITAGAGTETAINIGTGWDTALNIGSSAFVINGSGVITSSNNLTPNSILTTGQTDEYCLTYESTGTTFEWQTCGSGGSLFTDGGANTYLTATTDNLSVGGTGGSARLNVYGDIDVATPSSGISFMGTRYFYASSTNDSVVIGQGAGASFTTGATYNIALGFDAGGNVTTSDDSIYIGYQAGLNSASTSNAFVGYQAGYESVGDANANFGQFAGYSSYGHSNVLIGREAGAYNNGDYAVIMGYRTAYNATTSTDFSNIIGYYAGNYSNGYNNNIFGPYAGENLVGNSNNAIGFGSGGNAIGGANNYMGVSAGANTTGSYNSFIGSGAGEDTDGSYNYFFGTDAGNNISGDNNTLLGTFTMTGDAGAYTGSNNVALGYGAGYYATGDADANVLIGALAGEALTTGDNNIVIGYDIDLPNNAGNNQLNIGNIIYGTSIDGSGTTLSTGNIGIGTTTPSDKLYVYNSVTSDTGITVRNPNSNAAAEANFKAISNAGTLYMGIHSSAYGYSGGAAYLWNGANTALYFGTNDTEQMRITAAGNVGIGTTTPSQKLSVFGTNPQVLVNESITEFLRTGVGETSNTSVIGWDDSDSLRLGVYDSPTDATISSLLTILSTGELGIGDTNPAAALTVSDNTATVATFTNTSTSGSTAGAGMVGYSNDGAALASGDRLGYFLLGGSLNGSNSLNNSVGIEGFTSQAWSGTAAGAYMKFVVQPNGTVGSANRLEAMRIAQDGKIGIGTTTPISTLSIQGSLCVRSTGSCGSTDGTIYATTAAITDIDLAENYRALDMTIAAGELVALDEGEIATIKRAEYGDTVLGVISTAPGLLLGQEIQNSKPVALKGRIPVKVNMEGGEIEVGDAITLSSKAGIGTKATTTSYTVGIALEATDEDGTIEMFVQNQTYFSRDNQEKLAHLFMPIEEEPEDTLWARLTTLATNFVDGVLTVAGIRTSELCVEDESGEATCITKSQLDRLLEEANTPAASSASNSSDTSEPEPTPEQESEVIPEPEETPEPETETVAESQPTE